MDQTSVIDQRLPPIQLLDAAAPSVPPIPRTLNPNAPAWPNGAPYVLSSAAAGPSVVDAPGDLAAPAVPVSDSTSSVPALSVPTPPPTDLSYRTAPTDSEPTEDEPTEDEPRGLTTDPAEDEDQNLLEPTAHPTSVADTPSDGRPHPQNGFTVSQLDALITELLAIEGATGAAVVDIESGMALATGGNPGFDLHIAAAGNSNVVRAKLRTMADLGLGENRIEDILITLSNQYHLINVLDEGTGSVLFVYLVLNRANANLALARHRLRSATTGVRI